MAQEETEWADIKTDPLRDEFRLFFRSFRRGRFKRQIGKANAWPTRCDEWETHATLFACIKSGLWPNGKVSTASRQDTQPKPSEILAKQWEGPCWKEERIKFLFEHLNVLDTKLGMLLNFNSLLLIAINVLFGGLYNLVPKPFPQNAHILFLSGHFLIWVLAILSLVFGAFWLLITLLCLWGERRLVWGDLGLIEGGTRRPVLGAFKDASLLLRAEKDHVQSLIIAVVKRTNKFRVASCLTIINVSILAFTFTAGLGLLWAVNSGFLQH